MQELVWQMQQDPDCPHVSNEPLPICLYTLSSRYHFDMDSLLATTAQLACKIHRVPTFCHCSC